MAADPEHLLHNSRLGLRLNAERAAELERRLDELVNEYAAAADDADGERYGLFTTLHRLR
jgi:hypothetical protein